MELQIKSINGIQIAEVRANEVVIVDVQDALDLLGNSAYQGAENIIIHEKHLTPDFFDLKTGIAGELLQKFSTYNIKLAIVGDFSKYSSKSLRDFMYESNKARRINFVSTVEEAREKLSNLAKI